MCEFARKRKPHWEVRHVNDVGLHGATDDTIFQWAQSDLSNVITLDYNVADARMFPAGSHAGVIRLRVWPTTIENTEQRWRVCSTQAIGATWGANCKYRGRPVFNISGIVPASRAARRRSSGA